MTIAEADWLARLPEAVAPHQLLMQEQGALIEFDHHDHGTLELRWEVKPERCIALIRLPQLQVDFSFVCLPVAEREAFMQRFDLFMQRGGG